MKILMVKQKLFLFLVVMTSLSTLKAQILIATADNCIDKNPSCQQWKKFYCQAAAFRKYLRNTCPIACGYCTVVALEDRRTLRKADSELNYEVRSIIDSGFKTEQSRLRFDGSNFQGFAFENMDLSESSFNGAALRGVNFINCNLNGASFQGASLNGCTFIKSPCEECNFDGAKIRGTSFQQIDLRGASFDGSELRANNFLDTDTGKSNLDPKLCRGSTSKQC